MKIDYRSSIMKGVLIGLIGALLIFGIFRWLHVPPRVMLLASALMLALCFVAFTIHVIVFIRRKKELEEAMKDFERRKEEMKRSVDQDTRNILEAIEYVYNCTHGGEEE